MRAAASRGEAIGVEAPRGQAKVARREAETEAAKAEEKDSATADAMAADGEQWL